VQQSSKAKLIEENLSPARQIPFFDYQALYRSHESELLAVITDVLGRGAYILQRDLVEFEEKLAEYLGIKHAIGVANCTDGLALALDAAGIGTGDEVVFPSHTFVASAGAIREVGGIPVPVECAADHLIDVSGIEGAITERTRAIMPVQLNGRTAKMDAIQDVSEKNGLVIIEDAAQSLGSTYKNKKAGTFGLAAAFSFYPAKVLGCFGDGGAVVTDDDGIAEHIVACRDHGRQKDGSVDRWGRNSRLDNLQAAVLSYFLDRYDATVQRRRELADLYDEHLRRLDTLVLPPGPGGSEDHFDIFQNYEIEADDRDGLQAFLRENGIGTLVQWGAWTVHQFRDLGFTQDLPYTERMISRALMLPMNLAVTDDDVAYVCTKVKEYYDA
jgi:dTDP-4-amino-4,6-dideoxygalactose transaminase